MIEISDSENAQITFDMWGDYLDYTLVREQLYAQMMGWTE